MKRHSVIYGYKTVRPEWKVGGFWLEPEKESIYAVYAKRAAWGFGGAVLLALCVVMAIHNPELFFTYFGVGFVATLLVAR